MNNSRNPNEREQGHANPFDAIANTPVDSTVDDTANHTGFDEIGPSDLTQLASAIHRRQLATPLLLLLAGNRPLTFVAGQMLLAAAPMCALLGWEKANEWAEFLSAPNANQRVAEALHSPTIDSTPTAHR